MRLGGSGLGGVASTRLGRGEGAAAETSGAVLGSADEETGRGVRAGLSLVGRDGWVLPGSGVTGWATGRSGAREARAVSPMSWTEWWAGEGGSASS